MTWVADASALRDALALDLSRNGVLRSHAVEGAFRTVPRHLFLPETDPAQAYRDEAVVTDTDPDGRPTSSSSQPSIMAVMLEQLDVRPGHRVLEIGAGTGYNAALLAHLAGPAGHVVTLDLDEHVARRARDRLDQAGYSQVEVVQADGAYGWPRGAPYDRVILTVGAWDLAAAWREQLAPDGRLVVPLSLRGAQRSVAFEHLPDALTSVSIADCGFMPMRGALTRLDNTHAVAQPGVFLHVDDDRPIDIDALGAALQTPGDLAPTGVRPADRSEINGLDLWLWLHDPDTVRLVALGDAIESHIVPPLTSHPDLASTLGLIGHQSLAMLAPHQTDSDSTDALVDLAVRGVGPDHRALGDRLSRHVRDWAEHGRPSTASLRLRAYPRTRAPHVAEGSVVIDKPQTSLHLDWV